MSADHPGENGPGDKPTGEQLEAVFHAALKAGDVRGVGDVLTVMATVDRERAVTIYDHLRTALSVAKVVHGG